MNIESIIEGVENFYEVWSDGFSGDMLAVQKNLADLETTSIQTAKKTINTPSLIRGESSKEVALLELKELEGTGLKCRLKHVGPDLLNECSTEQIEKTLASMCKNPETLTVKEVKPGTFGIFTGRNHVEFGNIEFYLYLACIRYLAVHGKVDET